MATRAFSHTASRSRPPSENALKIGRLLSRYPDLSEPELANLTEAFRYLSIRDHVLLAADDRLLEKLEAFHRDRASERKSPLDSLALVVLVAILAAGALWWI